MNDAGKLDNYQIENGVVGGSFSSWTYSLWLIGKEVCHHNFEVCTFDSGEDILPGVQIMLETNPFKFQDCQFVVLRVKSSGQWVFANDCLTVMSCNKEGTLEFENSLFQRRDVYRENEPGKPSKWFFVE